MIMFSLQHVTLFKDFRPCTASAAVVVVVVVVEWFCPCTAAVVVVVVVIEWSCPHTAAVAVAVVVVVAWFDIQLDREDTQHYTTGVGS